MAQNLICLKKLSILIASLWGILFSTSCSSRTDISSVKFIANKYVSEGEYEEAITTLYDNLSDEQIADNALAILIEALNDIEPIFQDVIVQSHLIPMADINAAVLSNDKKWIVTADGMHQKINVFSYPDMKETLQLKTPAFVYTAMMNRDGDRIAAACHDGNVYFFEYPSGKEADMIHAHDHAVRDMWFTADGNLVTVSNDHTISICDIASGEQTQKMPVHSLNIKDLAISPDETLVATASNDGSIQTLEYDKGHLKTTGHYINAAKNYVNTVAISSDNQLIASGSGDCNIKFWRATDHRHLGDLKLDKPVIGLSFSPDGKRLIAGTTDGVYLIDAMTKEILAKLPVYGKNFWSVDFIDNNNVMVADQRTIKQLKLPTSAEIVALGRTVYENL